MPTPHIALVALDIAGTTVEEGGAVYRVLAEVVTDRGAAPTDADIRRWMGADKREAIAALLGGTPDPTLVAEVHADFVARLTKAYADVPPTPLAGVPEAIAVLRAAGIKVALTTGFGRQITDPLLASLGWAVGEQLDAVVCADEVAAGRPAPFMIQRVMELTGVTDASTVLAAGDTVLDVRAGLAAGAGVVAGVLTGSQTEAELQTEHPTHILAGVRDIPALLGLRPADFADPAR
ncbi:phosphonatase-like hydrolase [Pseudonocardia sp. GCM10023141]|uniref:phosphonatase-like hydrolase n=1 Tax=Pseudonocardia sp. GCM10023141 TaxID=3252653 RepID=UPI0036110F66